MNEELTKTLQSLRTEIEKLGEGEQESKKRLEQLVEDIETKIKTDEFYRTSRMVAEMLAMPVPVNKDSM